MKEKDLVSPLDWQVVEWSISQECPHICTVREMISLNLQTTLQNDSKDFIPIAIYATHAECLAFVDRFRKHFIETNMKLIPEASLKNIDTFLKWLQ